MDSPKIHKCLPLQLFLFNRTTLLLTLKFTVFACCYLLHIYLPSTYLLFREKAYFQHSTIFIYHFNFVFQLDPDTQNLKPFTNGRIFGRMSISSIKHTSQHSGGCLVMMDISWSMLLISRYVVDAKFLVTIICRRNYQIS